MVQHSSHKSESSIKISGYGSWINVKMDKVIQTPFQQHKYILEKWAKENKKRKSYVDEIKLWSKDGWVSIAYNNQYNEGYLMMLGNLESIQIVLKKYMSNVKSNFDGVEIDLYPRKNFKFDFQDKKGNAAFRAFQRGHLPKNMFGYS